MEFMIAWYPALKLGVGIILVAISIWLFIKKYYKANIALGVVFLIFMYLAPIKIDGTESHAAHQAEVQSITAVMEDAEEAPTVVTHKPTFAEQMEAEEEYSRNANKVIQDDIKGN